jgi:hypothetical protein
MNKYEYLCVPFDSKTEKLPDKIQWKLNELGAQGWECFFATQGPDFGHPQMRDFHTFYFKRPVE